MANELENYFLHLYYEDKSSLRACRNYISDCSIIAAKDMLTDTTTVISWDIPIKRVGLLKSFLTTENSIWKTARIPSEDGTLWKLPDMVYVSKYYDFLYLYDDNFAFNRKYIRLFQDLGDVKFYHTITPNNVPILKVALDDRFVGVIAAVKINKS